MYYPSSENKGADQLRGYREADLRLCFRICRLLVFPWGGSNADKLCLGCPLDENRHCTRLVLEMSVISMCAKGLCKSKFDNNVYLLKKAAPMR